MQGIMGIVAAVRAVDSNHAESVVLIPRLMKEYRDLTADPLQDTITAGPISEDNMLEWEALIQGPEGTPYVSYPPAFIDWDVVADDSRKEVYLPPSYCSYVTTQSI